MITKYRNLANVELLGLLCEKRAASPLIEELAQRIEGFLNAEPATDKVKNTAACPVCDASLTVTTKTDGSGCKLEISNA